MEETSDLVVLNLLVIICASDFPVLRFVGDQEELLPDRLVPLNLVREIFEEWSGVVCKSVS